MTGIAEWLGSQGLERYAPAFEAAEIDVPTLALLTDDDLRELGLPLGPRRRILSNRAANAAVEPALENSAASIGERRQITVMFVDLVGSTRLSTRVDPEILGDLLTSYKAAVAEEIAQAGGVVAKYLGDGVLAYFGWPKAREDAADCAIHCAFRIRDRIKQIEDPAGDPLQCRTGIATGLAVVGGTTGSGNAREDAVAGEVLNLAARLQAVAEPGEICVSSRVHELVGELFEFDVAGEHSLRGFDGPVVAWKPLREALHTNRFAAKRSMKRAFVGRDEELSCLRAHWSEAVDGGGRAVLVIGEAGIGKSRLLEELHGSISGTPHAFVGWQCSAFHQTKPLYPVIEYVTRTAGIVGSDDAPARLEKLRRVLSAAEMPTEDALPLFAALLSLPPETGYAVPHLTPAQRRSATIAMLGEWIRRIAEQKPVLLNLEDAHWADATTLELMSLLINAIGDIPLMAVITSRPEFAAPWSVGANLSVVGLDRLHDRDCEGLVREIIPADDVRETTIQTILARSDGNPLFVEELSAAVLESGSRERQVVPETLQGSLMARLDQLGDAKRTAQYCAVLGRRFARPLLAQLHDSPAVLDSNLSLLAAHDVVRPLGDAHDGHYEFKHALLRDAAYESLLLAERRRLHERCARQLEENFPEVVQSEPELLALHFAQAGCALEAADYLEHAGDRASANAAYIEAIASYRRGLHQTEKLTEGEARERRELGVLLKLGPALSIIDSPQSVSVHDVYQRADVLARSVRDLDLRFKSVWGLWYNANVGRDYATASKFADELVTLSEESHDDAHVIEALHCRWSSAMFRGECAKSIADAERGTKLYRRERHHSLATLFGGHDPGVCARSVAASAQVTAGQFIAAIRNTLDAISLADALHHPHSMAHALMNGLTAASTARHIDSLRQWGAALSALAETYNFPLQRALAAFFFEWTNALSGHLDLDRLRSTFNALFTIGPFTLLYTALFAEELLKAQQTHEALAVIDDLVGTLKLPFGYCLPEIYRVRGECLAALGRHDEALDELRHAGAVAAEQGAELFALRAALARARCCMGADEKGSAMTEIQRSLTAIGASDWPEIVAARDCLNRMSTQSAGMPRERPKASLPLSPA